MGQYYIFEDTRLKTYDVWIVPKVYDKISTICAYNHNNPSAIIQLKENIRAILEYVANPVIAWDNMGRYSQRPKNIIHINEFGCNVLLGVKISKFNNMPYVCIFDIRPNLVELGMKDPYKTDESKDNKQHNNMKKTIRLTEGMLHKMIKEAINELDWKTYQSAVNKQPSGYSRSYGPNGSIGSPYTDEVEKVFQNKLKQLGISSNDLAKRDVQAWIKLVNDSEMEVKEKEEKMYQRRRKFMRSAEDAFNRDFGFKDETGKLSAREIGLDNDVPEMEPYGMNDIQMLEPSKELLAAYRRARKEVDDFDPRNSDGLRLPSNYKYVKGKGWKLKNDSLDESIHRAIRRVLR